MEEEEFDYQEQQAEIERFRKSIANKIALRSAELIDALFDLAQNAEDDKVRLSAISQLLDRGIPKLGVDHSKLEIAEESSERKGLREEIEKLLSEDDEDDV